MITTANQNTIRAHDTTYDVAAAWKCKPGLNIGTTQSCTRIEENWKNKASIE